MVEVHFANEGPDTGATVMLSGSLGSDLRTWDPQVAPLTDAGYRVVRYDHRGHGRSPAPAGPYRLDQLAVDPITLLDRLAVDRVHWVGLSLGGMVGMWLGAHRPERIASLTLCCTAAELGPARMWADRAATVRAHGSGAVAEAVVERWFTPAWRAENPERTCYYQRMVAATPAEGYASCCTAIEHMDLLDDLPHITAPTLVISGTDDPATPPAYGARIAAGIAGARLETVDNAAHLGNAEQPERFSELILTHLEEAP